MAFHGSLSGEQREKAGMFVQLSSNSKNGGPRERTLQPRDVFEPS